MKTLLITAAFALSLGNMAAQSPSKDPEYARLVDTAFVLLRKGDCGPCLDFYENAFRHSRHSALSHLRAALCAEQCGNSDRAEFLSIQAVLIGWATCEKVLREPQQYPEFKRIAGSPFEAAIYDKIRTQAIASGIDLALRDTLKRIHEDDQKYRAVSNPHPPGSAEYQAFLDAYLRADSLNLVRIEEIIRQYGYPGRSTVGEVEASTAWLVIQHAPIEKQEQYFPMIEEAAQKGEISQSNRALLLDRIRMRRGEKQVYGSQVVRDDDNGQWKLHPIEDEANVNKRRAEIGMEPLEEYALRFGIVYAQTGPIVSKNPIFPGWYADPEAAIFDKTYWVYPTYSAPYDQQVFLDAFSSTDLKHWKKHARIIDTAAVKWAKKAMWAPAIIKKARKYYLFFSANDVHPGEVGGIGVAVAKRPEGPFKDHLGRPLIGEIHHGAQPIDQFVFMDTDGVYYMIYGGWGHCNMVRLNADFTGLAPFADGSLFKEITPKGYVEGPIMFQRRGKYYFMWSEGGWGGPDYRVAYAVSDSMFGPFERIGTVLQQDAAVATGAGHHSLIQAPGSDDWFIVYHRRPLGETDANHRVVCMDKMYFDEQGYIEQVKITN